MHAQNHQDAAQDVVEKIHEIAALLDRGMATEASREAQLSINRFGSNKRCDHAVSLIRRQFAFAEFKIGGELARAGNTSEAALHFETARKEMKLALDFLREAKNDGTFELPDAIEEYAQILVNCGREKEARCAMDEALIHLRNADTAAGKGWSKETNRLGNFLIGYLSFMKELFFKEDRLPIIDELIEIGLRFSSQNQNLAALYEERGDALEQNGKADEAKEYYRKAANMFDELGMSEPAEAARAKLG